MQKISCFLFSFCVLVCLPFSLIVFLFMSCVLFSVFPLQKNKLWTKLGFRSLQRPPSRTPHHGSPSPVPPTLPPLPLSLQKKGLCDPALSVMNRNQCGNSGTGLLGSPLQVLPVMTGQTVIPRQHELWRSQIVLISHLVRLSLHTHQALCHPTTCTRQLDLMLQVRPSWLNIMLILSQVT